MSGIGLKFDMSGLLDGMANFEGKAQVAFRMYAETSALKLQNSARANARWTDRTGQARQRLTGDSVTITNGYKLRLAHGVDYGKWLELANEKRYSIIPETIQTVGSNEIMPGFQKLLEKM